MARRAKLAVLIVCLGLVACGQPLPPTPVPSAPPPLTLGCFRSIDAAPGAGTPPVAQESADASARSYYAMNGATLADDTDATGATIPRPPIEARYLSIRASDYGSSGQGRAGGADPLRGRDAWLLGYVVAQATPWSPYRSGATVYLLLDARNAAPILGCVAGS